MIGIEALFFSSCPNGFPLESLILLMGNISFVDDATCLLSILFLCFQDSLTFMYQALERNIRTMFTGSSQRSYKHVSSPLASYFLSFPYTRLGW